MQMKKSRRDENSSYRSILKGASMFGSVQVFQMLINMVRSKFVAAILGPAGWGVSGLFTTSAATLTKTCSLGLNLAITKEIAQMSEDNNKLSTVVGVARRLLLATSLFGALICLFFSRLLSFSTFDSPAYTWGFILLSIYVAFTISGNGEMAMLQGLRETKKLMTASIVGSVTGLVVGVPMYYFWGTDGIVPAMCVLGLVTWGFYRRSISKSLPERPGGFKWAVHAPLVKKMIGIGLILMASDIIGSFTTYLAQIFIRHFSDLGTVGLYTSANMMTMQYSGVVLTAMAMDYLPRLAKVSEDKAGINKIVNRQTEVVSLIITPVVTLFILLAPLAIRILLTEEFMSALELIRWMALGVTFKAIMTPLGYVAFVKDNRKLFFWLEGVTGNFLTLILSCLFFRIFGLVGLGYAMVADGACCLVIYYFVNRRMYGYRFDRKALRSLAISILMSAGALLISLEVRGPGMYAAVAVVALCSVSLSFVMLRKILKADKAEAVPADDSESTEENQSEK